VSRRFKKVFHRLLSSQTEQSSNHGHPRSPDLPVRPSTASGRGREGSFAGQTNALCCCTFPLNGFSNISVSVGVVSAGVSFFCCVCFRNDFIQKSQKFRETVSSTCGSIKKIVHLSADVRTSASSESCVVKEINPVFLTVVGLGEGRMLGAVLSQPCWSWRCCCIGSLLLLTYFTGRLLPVCAVLTSVF
jgi:hypothetical protein